MGDQPLVKDYAIDTIYDNSVSGLASTDVQAAIDEVAALSTAVLVDNTAFVDGTNGSDVTGTIGDMEKPYATIGAALTAIGALVGPDAPAADNRYKVVVQPGEYAEAVTCLGYVDMDLGDARIVPAAGNAG